MIIGCPPPAPANAFSCDVVFMFNAFLNSVAPSPDTVENFEEPFSMKVATAFVGKFAINPADNELAAKPVESIAAKAFNPKARSLIPPPNAASLFASIFLSLDISATYEVGLYLLHQINFQ